MKKVNFQANLPVTFLREGQHFVAYTPALDLSTSGANFEQVQKRFAAIVQIFLEECHKLGTLNEVLLGLGWTKKDKHLIPPVVVAQDFRMFEIPVSV
ncbi:MAG TPA: hypothetical protein VJL36_02365 [Candidatus Paceibacterota bacterium]